MGYRSLVRIRIDSFVCAYYLCYIILDCFIMDCEERVVLALSRCLLNFEED